MRIGIVVDLADCVVDEVTDLAAQVEEATLDLIWLRSSLERPAAALAAASACASVAPALQVGAQVHVTTSNPVYLAEERNVVDQLLWGRLVLAVQSQDSSAVRLAEWTEVLLRAAGTTPFVHENTTVRVPSVQGRPVRASAMPLQRSTTLRPPE